MVNIPVSIITNPKAKKEEDETPFYFTTSEANQAVVSYAQYQLDHKDLSIGWPATFPTLHNNAPRIFPGQAWVVQACPGEGKSMFSSWWSTMVQNIARFNQPESGPRYAHMNVVLEESIELNRSRTMSVPLDFKKISMGEADMVEVMAAIRNSADDPMYYMGPSLAGGSISPLAAEFNGLSPYQIGQVVHELQTEKNTKMLGCVVDYIQLLQDRDDTRTDWARRIGNVSRELLTVIRNTFKCPTLICAQSDLKKVKDRSNKMPGIADVQWASQISQDMDMLWSLWKPAADMPLGQYIKIRGKRVPVLDDILICKIDKWRNTGMGGTMFAICLGKPVGDLFEIPLDKCQGLDAERLVIEGYTRYADIPEEYF